jgi:shikimate kinase
MRSKMKNIVITGFMGTGKTAVGRELARLLDMRLIDLDAEIEASRDMPINEIFKEFGEQVFREIETDVIKKLSRNKEVIISTGGGAVLKEENMEALRETGIIVCLMASPETILRRTRAVNDRPLLQVENPLEKIRELLDFRKPYYEKADIMIATDLKTPLQVAEEIAEKVKALV